MSSKIETGTSKNLEKKLKNSKSFQKAYSSYRCCCSWLGNADLEGQEKTNWMSGAGC